MHAAVREHENHCPAGKADALREAGATNVHVLWDYESCPLPPMPDLRRVPEHINRIHEVVRSQLAAFCDPAEQLCTCAAPIPPAVLGGPIRATITITAVYHSKGCVTDRIEKALKGAHVRLDRQPNPHGKMARVGFGVLEHLSALLLAPPAAAGARQHKTIVVISADDLFATWAPLAQKPGLSDVLFAIMCQPEARLVLPAGVLRMDFPGHPHGFLRHQHVMAPPPRSLSDKMHQLLVQSPGFRMPLRSLPSAFLRLFGTPLAVADYGSLERMVFTHPEVRQVAVLDTSGAEPYVELREWPAPPADDLQRRVQQVLQDSPNNSFPLQLLPMAFQHTEGRPLDWSPWGALENFALSMSHVCRLDAAKGDEVWLALVAEEPRRE